MPRFPFHQTAEWEPGFNRKVKLLFFAYAVYESERFGHTEVALCSDRETEEKWSDQNTDSFSRLCWDHPITTEIMRAAAKERFPVEFECNGVNYTLLRYNFRPEERFYNPFRKNHVARRIRWAAYDDIYVYSDRCRCTRCFFRYGFDSIENVCARVKTRGTPPHTVEMDMQCCRHCQTYFIDAQSLAHYERKYGPLKITRHHITGNETWADPRDTWTYNPDTVLSRNGYSTGLYTVQRQNILTDLIVSGKSSKAEIKDILTRFIVQRGERCPNAREKWESDLEFVNRFGLYEQPVVEFTG